MRSLAHGCKEYALHPTSLKLTHGRMRSLLEVRSPHSITIREVDFNECSPRTDEYLASPL